MIEKLEFYHGAALVRAIEDERCSSIVKCANGYLINNQKFLYIKYSTKSRTPWGFTFSDDDVFRLQEIIGRFTRYYVALVCGGDGICALNSSEVLRLLAGAPGRISVRRGHGGCYGVNGSMDDLRNKVAMNRWPNVIFE